MATTRTTAQEGQMGHTLTDVSSSAASYGPRETTFPPKAAEARGSVKGPETKRRTAGDQAVRVLNELVRSGFAGKARESEAARNPDDGSTDRGWHHTGDSPVCGPV